MKSFFRSAHRRLSSLLIVSLCAVGFGASAGCEEESEAIQTLEEVQVSMRSLSAGGRLPASAELRRKRHQEHVRELQGIAGAIEQTHQTAANRLLARAQAGLAKISAEEATKAASTMHRRTSAARLALDRYIQGHSLASALEAPDPTSELERIGDERSAVRQELSDLNRERNDLLGRIDDLRAEAEQRSAEADRLRAEAGQVRADALDQRARERAELIEGAVAIEREANAAAVEAERLQSRINRIEPELGQIEQQIARAERQIELADLATQSINARKARMDEEAASNREAAAEASRDFDERLAVLEETLSSSFTPALREGVSGLETAIATQRRVAASASGEGRVAARLSLGGLHLSLAELHLLEASTLNPLFLLMQQAADVTPRLAEGARYTDEAQTLRDRIESARGAARAAYAEARSNYETAGVRGEMADRLQGVVDRLGAASAQ